MLSPEKEEKHDKYTFLFQHLYYWTQNDYNQVGIEPPSLANRKSSLVY